MAEPEAEVWAELNGTTVRVGTIYSHRLGRTESATFAYEASYVALKGAYAIDPTLPLSGGSFQTAQGRKLFGAITDCAPDRWGRKLIERSERKRSERDGVTERSFGELDYALNVRDDLRQGALRFRPIGGQQWLGPASASVPHLITLTKLINAVDSIEGDHPDDEALKLLVRAGSSLGGARPKAAVINSRGDLTIAKFPRIATDEWDVMAWEKLALNLAERAGIRTPRSQLVKAAGRNVLLLNRFDRDGETRIGYVSAMTMLEAVDGDQRSYLEIAEVIEENSASATEDLRELWRRITFSILMSNTDDHLRNHGFLRTTNGAAWTLSPAFDLNPDPTPGTRTLSTSIDGETYDADLGTLMSVAPYFRLDTNEANALLATVRTSVNDWEAEARRLEISASEIDLMKSAFRED